MIKRQEGKICFAVMEGGKTTFGVVVSEFENNFWRENCREQYDFTKSLKFFP